MLSRQQIIKIDPELAALSEADFQEVTTSLYLAAQLAFDVYWTKKHGSKSPVGSLPSDKNNGNV